MKQHLALVLAAAALLAGCGSSGPKITPTTVDHVDLDRYTGTWYEIAKIPNRFQDQCINHTTATYTLRDDGRIDVLNRCQTESGEYDEAEGIARIVDTETNAKLEVSFVEFFGRNWFWGDYWILALGEDYSWVVIGHPDQEYGWVLAREPELKAGVMDRIEQILKDNGYRAYQFVYSPRRKPEDILDD